MGVPPKYSLRSRADNPLVDSDFQLTDVLIQLSTALTQEVAASLLREHPECFVKLEETLLAIIGKKDPIPPEAVKILSETKDKKERFLRAIQLLGIHEPEQFGELAERMQQSGLLKSMGDYEDRTKNSIALIIPVKLHGLSYLVGEVPFHITVKAFKPTDKKEDILALAEKLEPILLDADNLQFLPGTITSAIGNSFYVLDVQPIPMALENLYECLRGIGFEYATFRPHITIDKAFYDSLDGIISGKDLELEVFPMELRQGKEVLKRWDFKLEKAALRDDSEVSSIAVRSGGHLLMGKRRDSSRWTLPGGHANVGEEALEAAARELFEEAGIKANPNELKHLGSEDVTTFTGKKKRIHAYLYEHKGELPHVRNDPDKECASWEWIPVGNGLPDHVRENLHSPKNIVLQKLGLLPADLAKSEDDHGIVKFKQALKDVAAEHHLDQPDKSFWECTNFSRAAKRVADEHGVPAEIWFARMKNEYEHQGVSPGEKVGHHFLKIGDEFHDYTSSQFTPKIPSPFIDKKPSRYHIKPEIDKVQDVSDAHSDGGSKYWYDAIKKKLTHDLKKSESGSPSAVDQELRKMPLIDDQDERFTEGVLSGSSPKGMKHVSATKIGDNLWHQHFEDTNSAGEFHYHYLTTDSKIPKHGKNLIGHLHGIKQDGYLHVAESAVQPGLQNQGFGTQLYREAAKAHGKLASGVEHLSSAASWIYHKLAKDPEFKVKLAHEVEHADIDDDSATEKEIARAERPHTIKYIGNLKKSEADDERLYSPKEVLEHENRHGNDLVREDAAEFYNIIGDYKKFKVAHIPLHEIEYPHKDEAPEKPLFAEGGEDDEAYAHKYSKLATPNPPVIVNTEATQPGKKYKLHFGRHRTRAQYLKGEKTVRAFVPAEEHGKFDRPEMSWKKNAEGHHEAEADGRQYEIRPDDYDGSMFQMYVDGKRPYSNARHRTLDRAKYWAMAHVMHQRKESEPLKKGKNGDWEKEGYTLRHEPEPHGNAGVIRAFTKDGKEAGYVNYTKWHESKQIVPWSSIKEPHRRKGLATAMYGMAERETGYTMTFDDSQSNDAKALWSQPNRPFGKLKKHLEIVREQLLKAIDDEEWARLMSAHNPGYADIVDHARHLGTPPKELKALIESDKIHPANVVQGYNPATYTKENTEGIGAKIRYHIPHNDKVSTIQLKPYHKIPERGTEYHSGLPIAGWSTMATKALYHAAEIGHMAENVTTMEHKGIPVTATKFSEGYHTLSALQTKLGEKTAHEPKINPLHLQQLQLMDFLTGQTDRHGKNLMISEEPDSSGHNKLLAIDNDRAFQYHQNLSTMRTGAPKSGEALYDHPKYQSMYRALGTLRGQMPNYNEGNELMRQWWLKGRDKVMKTFLEHTQSLKDEKIAKHVVQNFTERFNAVNAWANNPDIHKKHGFFSPGHEIRAKHIETIPRIDMSLPNPTQIGTVETPGTGTKAKEQAATKVG